MFEVVNSFLISTIDILKVYIPMILVFSLCGDMLFRDR